MYGPFSYIAHLIGTGQFGEHRNGQDDRQWIAFAAGGTAVRHSLKAGTECLDIEQDRVVRQIQVKR
jgi:hypothetical protein